MTGARGLAVLGGLLCAAPAVGASVEAYASELTSADRAPVVLAEASESEIRLPSSDEDPFAESTPVIQPHPLAATRPGEDVVVCDGGCPGAESVIVYAEPKASREPSGAVVLKPTTVEHGAVAAEISCVAGCYGSPRAYPARAPLPPAPKTAAKAKLKSKRSAKPAAAPVAAARTKPAPGQWLTSASSPPGEQKTSAVEGWMSKINKERAAQMPVNRLR